MQCIVYDASGLRHSPTTAQEALTMILDGRAVLLEAHPTKKFRSQYLEMEVPTMIALRHVIKRKRKTKKKYANYSKFNLFLRDNYTCQYCNRHLSQLDGRLRRERPIESLTRDHVIPKERGGSNDWDNIVTACSTCNHYKRNRTPKEAGMKLVRLPYVPTVVEIENKNQVYK